MKGKIVVVVLTSVITVVNVTSDRTAAATGLGMLSVVRFPEEELLVEATETLAAATPTELLLAGGAIGRVSFAI